MKKSIKLMGLAVATLAVAAAVIGVSSVSAQTDDEILVWTDAVRLPGFQMYQKKFPNVKMRIVTVDTSQLPAKVDLFNKSGSGWPDVAFVNGPEQVAILSQKNINYTADLTPLVSKDIVSKFSQGALSQCRIGGKLYCLRNDIAQVVTWYNASLMKEFGYTAPTTYEEYQALGLRVAKEHPGYVVGSFGDAQALNMFLAGSDCLVQQVITATAVRINTSSTNCGRIASLVDTLVSAGSLSKFGPFDAEYIKLANENKILMMPGASWYGEFVFKAAYKTPAGQLSVGLPLRWANQRTPVTGTQGGGAYFVSTHAKNPQAAADIAIWMSTSNDYQADAPTQPAYLPAADAWGKKLASDKYYVSDPYPVLKASAAMINTRYGFVRYDTAGTFANIVVTGVKGGKTVSSLLGVYGLQLDQLAKLSGYSVIR